jgi:hypothetical protein
MTSFSIPIIQIILHPSKSASAILTRSITVVQTCIAIIQEPWLVKGIIRGLGNCGKVLKASTANNGFYATLLPQLSCGDLMSVQLRLTLADGTHRDVVVGSVYMPSEDLQSQEEIKEFGCICKRQRARTSLGL